MVTVANAIMKEGGFRAFYVGVATAAYRGALLTAAQAVAQLSTITSLAIMCLG